VSYGLWAFVILLKSKRLSLDLLPAAVSPKELGFGFMPMSFLLLRQQSFLMIAEVFSTHHY
jgi:hypothetical protein